MPADHYKLMIARWRSLCLRRGPRSSLRRISAFASVWCWLALFAAPSFAGTPQAAMYGAWVTSNVNTTTTNLSVGNAGVLERFNASDWWTGGDPSVTTGVNASCAGTPNTGNYCWNDLDTICTNAATGVGNSKNANAPFKIILDVEFGVSISDGERTRLAGFSPSALLADKWNFQRIITQSGNAIAPCNTIQFPLWYHAQWLADVNTFYQQLAARVTADGCMGAVAGVVNTAITYNDDEYSAVASQGTGTISCPGTGNGSTTGPNSTQCIAACGASPCTCTPSNDLAMLLALPQPYTGKLIADASAAVDGYVAAAFPNKVIEHMFLGGVTGASDRFPAINYLLATQVAGQSGSFPIPNEVSQIVLDAAQTNPQLWPIWEYQSNNLAASGTHLETVSRLAPLNSFIGYQSAGGGALTSEANFASAVTQAIQLGACHVEFYAGEPPNDPLGVWTDKELANCLAHNHRDSW